MILVVGATGQLGSMLARSLLAQGKQVRILVRPGSNYQDLVQAGAQPVTGDLKDRASLDEAVKEIETVVTTANSAQRGGDDNPQSVEFAGNQNLIEASKAAGVKHFIFVSTSGASSGSPIPFLAGKGAAEDALKASGMDYTIVAPTAFSEVWLGLLIGMPLSMGQPVTLVEGGTRLQSFISVRDVAAYTLASVDNPAARNQRLLLGGPTHFTLSEAVKMFEQAAGRQIPVQSVSIGQPLPLLPEAVWGLAYGLAMADDIIDSSKWAAALGVTPTPVEQVVRQLVAPPA